MADSSSVGILTNIFTAPTAAFAALKVRPSPWLALLIVLIGYAAVSYVYLQVVDLPWMLDRQLSQGGNLTEEQRRQAVETALQVSPTVYGVIGAITTPLSILIVFALIALYFTGVSFATNDGVKYKAWMTVVAWGFMPIVFGLAATFINLVVSDARFMVSTWKGRRQASASCCRWTSPCAGPSGCGFSVITFSLRSRSRGPRSSSSHPSS
jgi:hypothetical protein